MSCHPEQAARGQRFARSWGLSSRAGGRCAGVRSRRAWACRWRGARTRRDRLRCGRAARTPRRARCRGRRRARRRRWPLVARLVGAGREFVLVAPQNERGGGDGAGLGGDLGVQQSIEGGLPDARGDLAALGDQDVEQRGWQRPGDRGGHDAAHELGVDRVGEFGQGAQELPRCGLSRKSRGVPINTNPRVRSGWSIAKR